MVQSAPDGLQKELDMNLELPDELVRLAQANQTELRLALAIQLYADNRLDHVSALALADIPESVFNRELLARNLVVQKYPAPRRSAG